MYCWIADRIFQPVYKKKLSQHLVELIDDNSFVLDAGSGKGCISKNLEQLNLSLKTVCLDIKKTENIDINSDACFLPFRDKSFDVSILIDVLHHTTNIIKILKELKRVTKSHIIIKEQAYTTRITKLCILLGDSLTNRKCIFNHLHYLTWKEIFEELELKIEEEPKNLDFGFFLNEKMNQIWKLRV